MEFPLGFPEKTGQAELLQHFMAPKGLGKGLYKCFFVGT